MPTTLLPVATAVVVVVGALVTPPLLRRRATARRRARRAWSISTAAAGAGHADWPRPARVADPPQEDVPQEDLPTVDPAAPRPAGRRRADRLAPLDVVLHDGRVQTVQSVRHRLGGVDLTFTDGRTAALRPFDTLAGPPPHGTGVR